MSRLIQGFQGAPLGKLWNVNQLCFHSCQDSSLKLGSQFLLRSAESWDCSSVTLQQPTLWLVDCSSEAPHQIWSISCLMFQHRSLQMTQIKHGSNKGWINHCTEAHEKLHSALTETKLPLRVTREKSTGRHNDSKVKNEPRLMSVKTCCLYEQIRSCLNSMWKNDDSSFVSFVKINNKKCLLPVKSLCWFDWFRTCQTLMDQCL